MTKLDLKTFTRIIHFNFLFIISIITNNINGRNTFYHFSYNQRLPLMYFKSMLGVCISCIPFIYMTITFYLNCDFMAVGERIKYTVLILTQSIDCGYLLERSIQVGLNEYPQPVLEQLKKSNI